MDRVVFLGLELRDQVTMKRSGRVLEICSWPRKRFRNHTLGHHTKQTPERRDRTMRRGILVDDLGRANFDVIIMDQDDRGAVDRFRTLCRGISG
jgi:hypothetical protein